MAKSLHSTILAFVMASSMQSKIQVCMHVRRRCDEKTLLQADSDHGGETHDACTQQIHADETRAHVCHAHV